jgi:hypothetical protein
MREVMKVFSATELGAKFYLAGGTALALQIGHRKSVDLEFFSPDEDIPIIRDRLARALEPFNPLLADSAWGNLVFLVQNVQVGFYGYGYSMAGNFIKADGTRLASIEDIGLMKMDAILARASRKDFHDLYEICQRIPLKELLTYAPEKYPHIRDFESQVARRLVYFERAEVEESLPLIEPISWQQVKDYFRQQSVLIGRSWID